MTSHAAVVARGMGRPCVSGISPLKIDPVRGEMVAGNVTIARGDIITIDGGSARSGRRAGRMVLAHQKAGQSEASRTTSEFPKYSQAREQRASATLTNLLV